MPPLLTHGLHSPLLLTRGLGPSAAPPPPESGPDTIQAAVQAWFAGQPALAARFVDMRLWHVEAPEDTDLPYLTYFVVAEPEMDGRTTAYYFLGALVQFSAHAATDAEAARLRNAVRDTIAGAVLAIEDKTTWYALPGAQQLLLGEGRGPNGSDCWMGTVDVSLPWQRGSSIDP